MFRILPFLLVVVLFGCNKEKRPGIKGSGDINAFYYWQTSLQSFDWSDSVYASLGVKKIYYRFFDVAWDKDTKAPVPVSPLDVYYSYNLDRNAEVAPVVFITNEAFQNLDVDQSRDLARQLKRRLTGQMSQLLAWSIEYTVSGSQWWEQNPYQVKSKNFDEQRRYDSAYDAQMNTIREIQFDCDWTKSTREKYFAFLEEAKKQFPDKLISSTIRLYQYKYPKEAGVPPVSRGMLMCYNAGDIRKPDTKNSIFDKDEIMDYLEESNAYSIPLDYALPIFEWALLYQQGKLTRILSADELDQSYSQYLQPNGENKSTVIEEFVYGYTDDSIFIRRGDEIRYERPNLDDVQEVASWLSDNKNNKEAILTLYHLNTYDLHQHSQTIKDIYDTF
jgi:hypothetical protein